MTAFRPPATSILTPCLTAQTAARSIAFYESAFGFSGIFKHEQDGGIVHVPVDMNGEQKVMFMQGNASGAPCKTSKTLGIESSSTLNVYAPDVNAVYQWAPDNMLWEERRFQMAVADRYRWDSECVLGRA